MLDTANATAIVLSSTPCPLTWTGWTSLNHVSTFDNLVDLHAARLEALSKVTTEFCAYVDSDDELPLNTGTQIEVITQGMQEQHSNLTYTDWLEKYEDGSSAIMRPGPYKFAKHVTDVKWMHQLVVMRTETAQRITQNLPRGLFWTEFLLYAQLAKQCPIYYPHVAYVWHRKNTGMHTDPNIIKSQTNGVRWLLSKGLV